MYRNINPVSMINRKNFVIKGTTKMLTEESNKTTEPKNDNSIFTFIDLKNKYKISDGSKSNIELLRK